MAGEELVPLFITNLAGIEDFALGYDKEQQVRDGEIVAITQVNAHVIPYRKADGTLTTIGDVLDELFLQVGGN